MHSTQKRNGSRVKAVLFDLDGVLIHSYDAWYRLFNDALEHFGFTRIAEDVFRRHWGQSTKEDIRIFMPGRTIDEVRQYFIDHYGNYLSFITHDPNAFPVLHDLRTRGLLLGCVTNSHREITETILLQHSLQDCFNVIITADDVTSPKPAPEILNRACQYLRVLPGDTMFVGDTKTDLEAGRRAGCIMIGYRIQNARSVQDLKQLRDMISAM